MLSFQFNSQCFPNATIRHSDTGFEHMPTSSKPPPATATCERLDTVFVLENFHGDIFRKLSRCRCHLVGPQIVVECASNNLVSNNLVSNNLASNNLVSNNLVNNNLVSNNLASNNLVSNNLVSPPPTFLLRLA